MELYKNNMSLSQGSDEYINEVSRRGDLYYITQAVKIYTANMLNNYELKTHDMYLDADNKWKWKFTINSDDSEVVMKKLYRNYFDWLGIKKILKGEYTVEIIENDDISHDKYKQTSLTFIASGDIGEDILEDNVIDDWKDTDIDWVSKAMSEVGEIKSEGIWLEKKKAGISKTGSKRKKKEE